MKHFKSLILCAVLALLASCSTVKSNSSSTGSNSSATYKQSDPSSAVDTLSMYAVGAVLLTAMLAVYKVGVDKCETSSNITC